MYLRELLRDVDYVVLRGEETVESREIRGISYDSRTTEPGALFVCLEGARADGHRFTEEAGARGAAAFLVEKTELDGEALRFPEGTPVILVRDTREALASVSAAWFGDPAGRLRIIGVTGTKGKTTVACMIQELLEGAGHRTGLIGTVETRIGAARFPMKNTTPESFTIHEYFAKMVEEGCEYVVMEVSSQGIKQKRVAGISFLAAVFTNFGEDHVGPGEHASLEEYRYYKACLFRQCRIGIGNLDDPQCSYMFRQTRCEKYGYACQREWLPDWGGRNACGWKRRLHRTGQRTGRVLRAEQIRMEMDEEGPCTEFHVEGPLTEFHVEGPLTEFQAEGPHTEFRAEGPRTEFREEGPCTEFRAEGSLTEFRAEGPLTEFREEEPRTEFRAEEPLTGPRAEGVRAAFQTEGSFSGIRAGGPCTMSQKGETYRLRMPGLFNVYNALAALCTVWAVGVRTGREAEILCGIRVPGRMERILVNNNIACYIDYAHNAMSLRTVLRTLRAYRPGRILLVFGCGGNRAGSRRAEMGRTAGELADLTIITSDNPRYEEPESIMEDIRRGLEPTGGQYELCTDRQEAVARALSLAVPGDVVLIAGKGHETYQEIRGVRCPMDDHELVRAAVESREWSLLQETDAEEQQKTEKPQNAEER